MGSRTLLLRRVPSFPCLVAGVRRLRFLDMCSSSPASLSSNQDDASRKQGNGLAVSIQELLNSLRGSSVEEIEKSLEERCPYPLSDDLVTAVIKRHVADWRPAYTFFEWASRKTGYLPGSAVYNEILDTLGKMRRFDEVERVLEQMSGRLGLFNEKTYGVLLRRYAADRKATKETIDVFCKRRKEFGLELDLAAFQNLLMWLCRYKQVEEAEKLFDSLKDDFDKSIKTMNIILEGWYVLGDLQEVKRFWKKILASGCKPCNYTYGAYINALTKKGKLGTAMRLFQQLWENGNHPDVAICNCIINALCFKKRIPEALEVFSFMTERGHSPNVVTYNTLIKHMLKIHRMDKAKELLNDMASVGGDCLPNSITYGYILSYSKKPEDVSLLLECMAKDGCELTCDLYIMILRLYMGWGLEDEAIRTWEEMERNGLGPDIRSYTIMIHKLHDQGKVESALKYFDEMVTRGIEPKQQTVLWVKAMRTKQMGGEDMDRYNLAPEEDSRSHLHRINRDLDIY